MKKSVLLAGKQTEPENKALEEPKTKKNRSNKITTNTNTMDNGTMVEVFKYLDYCALAKNSLVSKRFCELIRTYRHKFTLLNVDYIGMNFAEIPNAINPFAVRTFDKQLFPEAYNDWVIRNHYSKEVALENQVDGEETTEDERKIFGLSADAVYKDSNNSYDTTTVFSARMELNHNNWPLFQHFVRLLTDPFICIRFMKFIFQIDVLNLLAGAINLDHNRLQCKVLFVNLDCNMQEFMCWIKEHVRCDKFRIDDGSDSSCDEELLDFFMTGGHCTPKIEIKCYDISKVIFDFVQKFMDLKSCDEKQMVECIRGDIFRPSVVDCDELFSREIVEALKHGYAEFIVTEERNENDSTEQDFVLTNSNIGKKLQLTITTILGHRFSNFSLKIENL
ncbi:hypothetical protein Ddc_15343 [Ditylenchus destructor]|nr:hypothetical protein Ddc_15343 [Ditylenchus destructor]